MTVDIDSILIIYYGITRGIVAIISLSILLYMLYLQIGNAIIDGIYYKNRIFRTLCFSNICDI